jgi:hypothetical protein
MERVDALTREVRTLREQIAPPDAPSLSQRIDHLADVVERRTAWWRASVAAGIVLVLAIAGGAFLLQLRTRAEIAEFDRAVVPRQLLEAMVVQHNKLTTALGQTSGPKVPRQWDPPS